MHHVTPRRSDPDLQNDLSDTQLRFTVEELSKPGVDTSRCLSFHIDSFIVKRLLFCFCAQAKAGMSCAEC